MAGRAYSPVVAGRGLVWQRTDAEWKPSHCGSGDVSSMPGFPLLSGGRATVVADYRVGSNIPVSSMTTAGLGQNRAASRSGDCFGAKCAEVIVCLQADSSVEVEITGAEASRDDCGC